MINFIQFTLKTFIFAKFYSLKGEIVFQIANKFPFHSPLDSLLNGRECWIRHCLFNSIDWIKYKYFKTLFCLRLAYFLRQSIFIPIFCLLTVKSSENHIRELCFIDFLSFSWLNVDTLDDYEFLELSRIYGLYKFLEFDGFLVENWLNFHYNSSIMTSFDQGYPEQVPFNLTPKLISKVISLGYGIFI